MKRLAFLFVVLLVVATSASATTTIAGRATHGGQPLVGVGQTARADAEMTEEAAEAPGVAASVAAAVETTGVQTNALTSLIDRLPVGRDPVSVVDLALGTQGRAISGGGVNNSLWLIDGA